MSSLPDAPGRTPDGGKHPPVAGESVLQLSRTPGKVEVEVQDVEALLDRDTPPAYPHTGPMLNATIAQFMLDAAREDRHSTEIELTVAFRESSPPLNQEAGLRAKISSYFANEVVLAELEKRVNRIEALGSLRYALPIVAVAAVFAGLLASPSTFRIPSFLDTFAYLFVVVIIWLMVWDPTEKLFFDSYFIRLRIRALQKLVAARIVFVSRPSLAAPTAPDSTAPSALETIRKTLEG